MLGACESEAGGAPASPLPAKPNSGWFKPGDARINRRGRPIGSDAGRRGPGKRQYGRLKTLFVPGSDMRLYLTAPNGPFLTNLPNDFEIVGASVDPVRQGLVLTVYSESFEIVKRGRPIPEFPPDYNGLAYRNQMPRQYLKS